MDTQTEKSVSSLYKIGQVSKTLMCPKCHSIFVTEKECEACGYQIGIDKLGEPFGLKSFFGIRDEYQFSYPWLFRLVPFGFGLQSKGLTKYRGALRRRFETLMTYFSLEKGSNEERKLFLFEAREIIQEYWNCHGKLSHLWVMTERIEEQPFFMTLIEDLKEYEQRKRVPLQFKWEGLLPPSFVLKLLVGIIFIVGSAYLTFLALLR